MTEQKRGLSLPEELRAVDGARGRLVDFVRRPPTSTVSHAVRAFVGASGSTRTTLPAACRGHTDVTGPPASTEASAAGPYGATIRYSVGDATNSQGVSPP